MFVLLMLLITAALLPIASAAAVDGIVLFLVNHDIFFYQHCLDSGCSVERCCFRCILVGANDFRIGSRRCCARRRSRGCRKRVGSRRWDLNARIVHVRQAQLVQRAQRIVLPYRWRPLSNVQVLAEPRFDLQQRFGVAAFRVVHDGSEIILNVQRVEKVSRCFWAVRRFNIIIPVGPVLLVLQSNCMAQLVQNSACCPTVPFLIKCVQVENRHPFEISRKLQTNVAHVRPAPTPALRRIELACALVARNELEHPVIIVGISFLKRDWQIGFKRCHGCYQRIFLRGNVSFVYA